MCEKQINEKVAIVTGGAQGIGQGICLRLAEEGTRVAIFDVNLDEAKKIAQEIERAGGTALALKVDITKSAEVEAAVKQVVSKFAKVDILVNNAGVSLSCAATPHISVSKNTIFAVSTTESGKSLNLVRAVKSARSVV